MAFPFLQIMREVGWEGPTVSTDQKLPRALIEDSCLQACLLWSHLTCKNSRSQVKKREEQKNLQVWCFLKFQADIQKDYWQVTKGHLPSRTAKTESEARNLQSKRCVRCTHMPAIPRHRGSHLNNRGYRRNAWGKQRFMRS